MKQLSAYLFFVLFGMILFYSCGNDIKEVRDFLADKNLPIGVAEDINMIYKDSGEVTTKMHSPLLYDYSNREEHPYSEFPEGLHLTKIDTNGDSITIDGEYAISYSKTNIAEIKGNVVIINHAKRFKLTTEQLFWDQGVHYFVTEKPFVFITPSDTLVGEGFESSEDLRKWQVKNNSGVLRVED
jgi:LPS export ABC transporter protein LptC